MGGMHGFGPVRSETDEPIFHARWEARVLGLNLGVGRAGWNIDASRHARESLPPAVYINASYYEIWARGLEKLLVEHALIDDHELASGHSRKSSKEGHRVLTATAAVEAIRRGSPYDRPVGTAPRFTVGQRVRARNIHPSGHTRLPRYVRGHVGVIERAHGGYDGPSDAAEIDFDTSCHRASAH